MEGDTNVVTGDEECLVLFITHLLYTPPLLYYYYNLSYLTIIIVSHGIKFLGYYIVAIDTALYCGQLIVCMFLII